MIDTASAPFLRCQNVWKIFGQLEKVVTDGGVEVLARREALGVEGIIGVNDASFDLNADETLAIMGLSGSGKSTLIRCLSFLHLPTLGRVEIQGTDLSTLKKAELAHLRQTTMSMVFQNFALMPHRTALDNVIFPLEVQKVDRNTCRTKAMAVLEKVGLSDRADNFPHQLSGGQKQRVGIARSLMNEPKIWFLDEPFSALDPLIRREMQIEFLRLASETKAAVAFVTHDFEEAIRLGDRIAIMKDGVIEQIDRAENLILAPATDYVKAFIDFVPRETVLTARSTMRVPQEDAAEVAPIDQDTVIRDCAEVVLANERPVPVMGTDGQIIGLLHREDVLSVLLHRPTES